MKRTALMALFMIASLSAWPQATSKSPSSGDTDEVVAVLKKKVAALESALEAIQVPTRYVIIAVLDEATANSAEAKKLMQPGQTAGLPTIMHNWICTTDPCRRAKMGNIVFFGRDDRPAEWPQANTHVAAKSFDSMFEADQWLNNSLEGRFLLSKAHFVMGASVTEYSQTINGSTPTVQQIRAIK